MRSVALLPVESMFPSSLVLISFNSKLDVIVFVCLQGAHFLTIYEYTGRRLDRGQWTGHLD